MFDDFPYDILFLEICFVLFFLWVRNIRHLQGWLFPVAPILEVEQPKRKILKHVTENQWGSRKFSCILTSSVNIMKTVFKIFRSETNSGSLMSMNQAATQQERWNSAFNCPQHLTWIDWTYIFTLVLLWEQWYPCSGFLVIFALTCKACMLYHRWAMKSSDSPLVRYLPTHWKKDFNPVKFRLISRQPGFVAINMKSQW